MADKSVPQLNAITSVASGDLFHVVRSNIDYKLDYDNLLSQLNQDLVPDANLNIFSYEVTLTLAQILDLHNTAVTLTPTDLGLSSTQSAKIHPHLTEFRIKPDGSAFTQVTTPYINIRQSSGAHIVTRFYFAEALGLTSNTLFVANSPTGEDAVQRQTANSGVYFDVTGGSITGGGASATIKIKIYYEKIEVTF